MIQVILNSIEGLPLKSNVTISVTVQPNVNNENLNVNTNQSKPGDTVGIRGKNYINLPKINFITQNPVLPVSVALLQTQAEQQVLDYINSLKLPQVVSAVIV